MSLPRIFRFKKKPKPTFRAAIITVYDEGRFKGRIGFEDHEEIMIMDVKHIVKCPECNQITEVPIKVPMKFEKNLCYEIKIEE